MDASSHQLPLPGISVVICCYNSAARLPETLRHLLAQQVPADIAWEVVVIDNASTDATEQVAHEIWPSGAPATLRVVREDGAGLSHARVRGVAEARHEIISFIDDDNWVPVDWVARVGAIFAEHPEVGVCGGRSEPVPESPLPAWFDRMPGYYATGSQHARSGDVTDTTGTLLWGAGLNLRTQAVRALFAAGFTFLMSGRSGANLGAGEDTELCYALREAGWRFWYDDALVLRHFIPQSRLTWRYALRLMEGMGASAAMYELYLMALRRPPFHRHAPWKRTWLFQFAKALKDALVLFLFHPAACVAKPEGSWPALQFAAAGAKVRRLVSLAGGYDRLRKHIRAQLGRKR